MGAGAFHSIRPKYVDHSLQDSYNQMQHYTIKLNQPQPSKMARGVSPLILRQQLPQLISTDTSNPNFFSSSPTHSTG